MLQKYDIKSPNLNYIRVKRSQLLSADHTTCILATTNRWD